MSKHNKSGSIRIIGGQWRGRKLPVLEFEGLRPTTDRVRETLFNWLMYQTNGAKCLDLFAGSGALGTEALSRGASHVDFIELNRQVAKTIEQNCNTLLDSESQSHDSEIESSVKIQTFKVIQTSALDFLKQTQNANQKAKYDIVFIDPPFSDDILQPAIDLLQQNNWLNSNALIYVEQARKQNAILSDWQELKAKKVGASAVYLYQTS